jgi:hypothetical protein
MAEAALGLGKIDEAVALTDSGFASVINPSAFHVGHYLKVLSECEAAMGLASQSAGGREHILQAARLLGAGNTWIDHHMARINASEPDCDRLNLDILLPGWQSRPDRGNIQKAWDEGCAMTLEQAMAYRRSISEEENGGEE